MNNETAKVIVTLLGVAGLTLYGYLLFMSDISVENQKYTVIAASLGLLFPMVSLSRNEFLPGNEYKAYGIGLLGVSIILFAGYYSKVDTESGLIWDFFKAISTERYRVFYFFILLLTNICPLISKRYSVWLSAFTIGVMLPVLIASLLVLAIIIGGLSALGASAKSNSSTNSWSSIFSNSSDSGNSLRSREITEQQMSQSSEPLYTFWIEYDFSEGSRMGPDALSHTMNVRLPGNASFSDIDKVLKKRWGNKAKVLKYWRES